MRRIRSRTPARLIGAAVLAATAAGLGAVATPTATAAPAVILGADSPQAIKDSYIVVLKDTALQSVSTAQLTTDVAGKYGATVKQRYTAALRGFHGTMSARAAQRLAADPAVALVQQDMYAENVLLGTQTPTPSWGIDRVDQRDLPLNNTYNYPDGGSNVRVYVVDTGVRISHSDFGGRASHGRDTIDNDNDATDCMGHGTHVAGTAAGTTYGVAKNARIVGVRMINCSGGGPVSAAVAGVDWVTANAVKPAVANASWGYPPSLDPGGTIAAAVRNSLASGVVWAFAAGNESSTTCTRTPQDRVPELLLAMASTRTDGKASFSNYGGCGDLFAPGDSIVSASYSSDTGSATMSGTSMASPHIAGAEAVYLAANPTANDAQTQAGILAASTPNKITNPGAGTVNKLLYVAPGGTNPGAPTVTNPGNRTSTVGTATSLQLTASGGTTPYTWSASGLPAGLSINSSTGLVSGTPTTAGTSTVTVTATGGGQSGSASFTWTVNGTGGSCATQSNGTDVAIPDAGAAVSSSITVAGCNRNASATSRVAVDIKHTYRGDLVIDLVAPDGSLYRLKNSSGSDSADNVITTYTVNLSTEAANGTWRLQVRDVYSADIGRIDTWSLTI